jgi:hypothetical protein
VDEKFTKVSIPAARELRCFQCTVDIDLKKGLKRFAGGVVQNRQVEENGVAFGCFGKLGVIAVRSPETRG